jgi:transposase-like protein
MLFRTKAERQQHLFSQRKSGLSITAYCKREGIHQNTFYNWRRQPNTKKSGLKPVTPVSFLQLPTQPPDAQKFDLTLPNGARISMPLSCEPVFLRQVVRTLSFLRPR